MAKVLELSWDDVLDRSDKYDVVPAAKFTGELLRSLRSRWERLVDVDFFWIHGVRFHRRGGPTTEFVRVLLRQSPGGDVVEVGLDVEKPWPGHEDKSARHRFNIAGDICWPMNAATVVESFLLQLVESE